MSTQNLIIYKFISLYHILEELGLDINFKISFADNQKSLNDENYDRNQRGAGLAGGLLGKAKQPCGLGH